MKLQFSFALYLLVMKASVYRRHRESSVGKGRAAKNNNCFGGYCDDKIGHSYCHLFGSE